MAVLERVPVRRITAEARQVDAGQTVLTLVAAVLYAVGWVPSTLLRVAWLALTWSGTAIRVGWTDARRPGG